jgi:hypothetical protein
VRHGRLRNWAYSCPQPDLDGILNVGACLTDAHVPGTRDERIIRLERDILSKNGAFARANRDRLKAAGIFTLNLVSSPGSDKTSLVVRTIALWTRWNTIIHRVKLLCLHPGRDDRRIRDTQWCRENNAACFLRFDLNALLLRGNTRQNAGAAQRHNGGGDNGPTASLADASERGCGASASCGCAAIGRTASTARCVRDRYVSR